MSTLDATAGGGAGRSAHAAQRVKAAAANERAAMAVVDERQIMTGEFYCFARRESGIVLSAEKW